MANNGPMSAVGHNTGGNWVGGGIHSLDGRAGLPSTSVSHGASGQMSNLMDGPGLPGSGSGMSTTYAPNTGPDPIGDPRHVTHTQYMVDTTLTNIAYDLGDMELVWMNTMSGDESLSGQHKPHELKSWHAMNRMLQTPEARLKWGKEKDTAWFNKIYSFAGVLRHLDTKGRLHAESGDLCQLVATAGKVTMYNIFMACDNRQSQGPQIGDLLQMLLVKVKLESELDKALPLHGHAPDHNSMTRQYAWRLIPYFDKNNAMFPPSLLYDRATKTMGQAFIIGRVSSIYSQAQQPAMARAVTRKMFNSPVFDASYQEDLYKVGRIEILVTLT